MPKVEIIQGNCLEVLPSLPADSFDACITDPPYNLTQISRGGSSRTPGTGPFGRHTIGTKSGGFMGQEWDATPVPFDPKTWDEVHRVLKPGAHLLAFGGTRTFHRLTCAIEDAGFEIRDCIMWLYGSGMPKSKNLDNEFKGFGTGLKPSWEPIILARKQLSESTVLSNMSRYGTGAINIDAARIEAIARPLRELDAKPEANGSVYAGRREAGHGFDGGSKAVGTTDLGRWPANLVLAHSDDCKQVGTRTIKGRVINRFDDGAKPFGNGAGHAYTSESFENETISTYECEPDCPIRLLDEQSGLRQSGVAVQRNRDGQVHNQIYGAYNKPPESDVTFGDFGGASRFFYTSKASSSEKNERLKPAGLKAIHPTVKPLDLMQYLIRLVTRPGGNVLDCFAGSGTTGVAAIKEGINCTLIEQDETYVELCRARIDGIQMGGLFDSL